MSGEYRNQGVRSELREGETIEGSRTMRNRPYPVLKCSSSELCLRSTSHCFFSRLIALRAASRSPSPSVFTPSAAMSLADLVTVINDLSAASQFNQLLTHLQSQEEMMIQQLPQLDEALASQRHVVAAAAAAKNRAALLGLPRSHARLSAAGSPRAAPDGALARHGLHPQGQGGCRAPLQPAGGAHLPAAVPPPAARGRPCAGPPPAANPAESAE